MTICLKKGQRINLKKIDTEGIKKFCVACKWNKIKAGGLLSLFGLKFDVDLDLSCVLFDNSDSFVDWIYSPYYNAGFLAGYGYRRGKLATKNLALIHSGDDLEGGDGDENLDNEVIKVDLTKISPNISKIVFFLNYAEDKNIDLSRISFFKIRLFEGEPNNCIREYMNFTVDTINSKNFIGKRAIIMGGLLKEKNEWTFKAIGRETSDKNICVTMDYIKTHIGDLFN
jgi:tellurium resistance protein TerZ